MINATYVQYIKYCAQFLGRVCQTDLCLNKNVSKFKPTFKSNQSACVAAALVLSLYIIIYELAVQPITWTRMEPVCLRGPEKAKGGMFHKA